MSCVGSKALWNRGLLLRWFIHRTASGRGHPEGYPTAEGLQGSRVLRYYARSWQRKATFKIDAVESKACWLRIPSGRSSKISRFAAPLAGTGEFGPIP